MEVPCSLLHNLLNSTRSVTKTKNNNNKKKTQFDLRDRADNKEIIIHPEHDLHKVMNLNCFLHCVH